MDIGIENIVIDTETKNILTEEFNYNHFNEQKVEEKVEDIKDQKEPDNFCELESTPKEKKEIEQFKENLEKFIICQKGEEENPNPILVQQEANLGEGQKKVYDLDQVLDEIDQFVKLKRKKLMKKKVQRLQELINKYNPEIDFKTTKSLVTTFNFDGVLTEHKTDLTNKEELIDALLAYFVVGWLIIKTDLMKEQMQTYIYNILKGTFHDYIKFKKISI